MVANDFLKKQDNFKRSEFFSAKDLGWENRRILASRKISAKPKGGWKWVLGLLLGSLLVSLGVWLWGNFSTKGILLFEKFNLVSAPDPTPTPTPTPVIKQTGEIVKQISNLTENLHGTYGVYVFNLTTKHSYSVHSNEVFTAASLIKLPLMITIYKEVEKGNLNLDTKYSLTQADKQGGAGSMQYKPAGTIYTYRQMIELMGQLSDNTAFNVFRKVLNDSKIQGVVKDLGMINTSFEKNETTPEDIGLLFRKLYGGNIISIEHRDELLQFLTKTAYEDRIPAGVPEGVRVAHKIGNEIGVFSDAGIVFSNRPFILVIMSKEALDKEAKTALPQITKAVWDFETKD